MTKKQIGKLGEDIAVTYLEKNGFDVKDRNYLKKYGEIDIVAERSGMLHFVEVKTVTSVEKAIDARKGRYRVEENISQRKLQRLGRVVHTYLENKGLLEHEWKFLGVIVKLNLFTKMAHVYTLADFVL
jgi:putative endonuclease